MTTEPTEEVEHESVADTDWETKPGPEYSDDELYNYALEVQRGMRWTHWHVEGTLRSRGEDVTPESYRLAMQQSFALLALLTPEFGDWLKRHEVVGFHARLQDATTYVEGVPVFLSVAFWTRDQWAKVWAHMETMEAGLADIQPIICAECLRAPGDISEYVSSAQLSTREETPEEYVMREEGTYNPHQRTFWCTQCYLKIGMPLGIATPRKSLRS
jgi:hypothetical protein